MPRANSGSEAVDSCEEASDPAEDASDPVERSTNQETRRLRWGDMKSRPPGGRRKNEVTRSQRFSDGRGGGRHQWMHMRVRTRDGACWPEMMMELDPRSEGRIRTYGYE